MSVSVFVCFISSYDLSIEPNLNLFFFFLILVDLLFPHCWSWLFFLRPVFTSFVSGYKNGAPPVAVQGTIWEEEEGSVRGDAQGLQRRLEDRVHRRPQRGRPAQDGSVLLWSGLSAASLRQPGESWHRSGAAAGEQREKQQQCLKHCLCSSTDEAASTISPPLFMMKLRCNNLYSE